MHILCSRYDRISNYYDFSVRQAEAEQLVVMIGFRLYFALAIKIDHCFD